MTEGQIPVLHGTAAIETPLLIGVALGELALEITLGFEADEELFGEAHIDLQVFSGQHDGLAGEAVAQGVQRCAALALGRDGSSGVGGVLTIDFCTDSWVHGTPL